MKTKIILTFGFLFFVWLLFTLSLDAFSLLLGVVFSASIAFFTYDIFVDDGELVSPNKLPKPHYFLFYFLVIIFEVFLGSFLVAYYVLTMRINPGIVKIKTGLKSKFGRALLANSITLTPGTVAVDLREEEIFVHWLSVRSTDPDLAATMIKGSFEKQLQRIFY